MPQIPKNSFAFPTAAGSGSYLRINSGDTEQARNDSPKLNLPDREAVLANELQFRGLFLDTPTTILRERGHDLDMRELFITMARHPANPVQLYGSQVLLHIRDFPKDYQHKTESSTRYHFDYRFHTDTLKISEPIFSLDARAWELLGRYAAPPGSDAPTQDAWGGLKRRYCEQFMRMAQMAEHDYLHQLVSPLARMTHASFPTIGRADSGTYLEDHALVLHADICQRLFADNPLRKQRVLAWAAEGFSTLIDIQQAAYAHASDPKAQRAIDEAVTYLTEIYANRLFRVIPPNDPDLRAPLDPAVPERSIASLCDALVLKTPPALLGKHYRPQSPQTMSAFNHACRYFARWSAEQPGLDGLDRVRRHTERYVGDTYTRIHSDTAKQTELYELGMRDIDYIPMDRESKAFHGPKPRVHCAEVVARMLPSAMTELDKRIDRPSLR